MMPSVRSDGKMVKPLPGRAWSQSELINDWKWMFRIGWNWRTGEL